MHRIYLLVGGFLGNETAGMRTMAGAGVSDRRRQVRWGVGGEPASVGGPADWREVAPATGGLVNFRERPFPPASSPLQFGSGEILTGDGLCTKNRHPFRFPGPRC